MAIQKMFTFTKGNPSQRCPGCDEPLPADCLNIKEGVALCPGCQNLIRLSEVNFSDRSIEEIVKKPARGCSIDETSQGVVITASLRSIGAFIACAAFALIWNSIVSIFLLLTAAGLYSNLIGPLPVWFPAPGLVDGKPQINGGPMGLSETLFLCVFLTPFVIVGIGTACGALVSLIGKVEVVIDEHNSFVATGFGIMKWRTRFDPHQIREVKFTTSDCQSEGDSSRSIEITADRTVKFGSSLPPERKKWMWAALKSLLRNASGGHPHSPGIPELSWLRNTSSSAESD